MVILIRLLRLVSFYTLKDVPTLTKAKQLSTGPQNVSDGEDEAEKEAPPTRGPRKRKTGATPSKVRFQVKRACVNA